MPVWYADCLTNDEVEELVMGLLDRARKIAGGGPGGQQVQDKVSAEKYPTLMEALTMRAVVEGNDTNRFSLSVFVAEGLFKAIIRDKVDKIACWVTSRTLQGLFPTLEAALVDPDHEWRQDRFSGAETARRTRKGT